MNTTLSLKRQLLKSKPLIKLHNSWPPLSQKLPYSTQEKSSIYQLLHPVTQIFLQEPSYCKLQALLRAITTQPIGKHNYRLTLLNPTTPIQNYTSRSVPFNLKHQYELMKARAKNSRIENTRGIRLLRREAGAQVLCSGSFLLGSKKAKL